ncbi:hypothetical protein BGZ60DRAFT_527469 [Tricladium varicosporioides]|nr:hypothetical protein BGZ60DRAFT_527469 [Hymenoscyphus varicosporioides]
MRLFSKPAEQETAKVPPPNSMQDSPQHQNSSASLPTYPEYHSVTRKSSSTHEKDASQHAACPITDKLRKILDEYDPKPNNVPNIWPMSEHREVIRGMFLDNILYATVKLHRHNWILTSSNEKYKELHGTARWDKINSDLEHYAKAIQSYEYWLTSSVQRMELDRGNIQPPLNAWSRSLAILECTSHHATKPDTKIDAAILEELSQSLGSSHASWTKSNALFRTLRRRSGLRKPHSNLRHRLALAIFGGGTLILPMIIMMIKPASKMVTTTGFTLVVGCLLAYVGENARKQDIIFITAAYAAILVVFVGR